MWYNKLNTATRTPKAATARGHHHLSLGKVGMRIPPSVLPVPDLSRPARPFHSSRLLSRRSSNDMWIERGVSGSHVDKGECDPPYEAERNDAVDVVDVGVREGETVAWSW